MERVVSIIICTRNRAESLKQTLEAVGKIAIPVDLTAELLVVDNGSTDYTAALVQKLSLPNMAVRYIHEPRPGQCFARNRGLAESHGEVIVFTDDDVRPACNWLTEMCKPILEDHADILAGGVELAEAVQRPWLTTVYRSWLASTEYLGDGLPKEAVGANMAFSRRVLDKVPKFDEELGPGALGQSDDSLFSRQAVRAGFRLHNATGVKVIHYPDINRITAAGFYTMARNRGRSEAYLHYHWEHRKEPRLLFLRICLSTAKAWRSRRSLVGDGTAEGPKPKQLRQIYYDAYYRQWYMESRGTRHYDKFGLVKIT